MVELLPNMYEALVSIPRTYTRIYFMKVVSIRDL